MRKRDYAAIAVVLLINALLTAFLVSGAYVTVEALLQGQQAALAKLLSILSLLLVVSSLLFCAATFFWIIRRRYHNAAKVQQFCLVAMVSQCVVAAGTLLQPAPGGVGGLLAAIGTLVLITITVVVTIPWLLLRLLASRYNT